MRVFLATPISSYRDTKSLRKYKKEILNLVNTLKLKHEVYSEIEKIQSESDYDLPEESIKIDLQEIKECDLFILHYPEQIPTSALIELGFALAEKKKIIIVTPSIGILPYLALGIDAIDEKSKIIFCDSLDKSIEAIIDAVENDS